MLGKTLPLLGSQILLQQKIAVQANIGDGRIQLVHQMADGALQFLPGRFLPRLARSEQFIEGGYLGLEFAQQRILIGREILLLPALPTGFGWYRPLARASIHFPPDAGEGCPDLHRSRQRQAPRMITGAPCGR